MIFCYGMEAECGYELKFQSETKEDRSNITLNYYPAGSGSVIHIIFLSILLFVIL
jgi:uncharacterized membrane protein YfhO